jgi:hypothetical protein
MLSDNDFVTLHGYIGMAPVLPTATAGEVAAYETALNDAKNVLAAAYGFDAGNVAVW